MDVKRDALKKIMRDSIRKKLSGHKKELPVGKPMEDEESGSDLVIRIKRMRNA